MKGILKKTLSSWIVNYNYTMSNDDWCTLQLHPDDVEQINKDSQVFDNIEARIAAYPEVEFEMVSVNGLPYHYAKITTPMIARLRKHLDSITPEQFEQEIKEIEDSFICEDLNCSHCAEDIAQMEDDELTDDEWIIKEKHKEITSTAVNFAKWISEGDWMSIWVEDKWMWEHQEELSSSHKWFGYKTNEELFELYKASKQ